MQYKPLRRAAFINKFAIQNCPQGVANCNEYRGVVDKWTHSALTRTKKERYLSPLPNILG